MKPKSSGSTLKPNKAGLTAGTTVKPNKSVLIARTAVKPNKSVVTARTAVKRSAARSRAERNVDKRVRAKASAAPIISIVMGSQSDYETLKHAEQVMIDFGIKYEIQVVSAHRTPDWMYEFAKQALHKGIKVIIAGAGGSAHLPGMISALTTLPVLGIPVESKALKGLDSLLSIVQMPAGVPTATFAIGVAGATNAGLFALQILALNDPTLSNKLSDLRQRNKAKALSGNKIVQRRLKKKK